MQLIDFSVKSTYSRLQSTRLLLVPCLYKAVWSQRLAPLRLMKSMRYHFSICLILLSSLQLLRLLPLPLPTIHFQLRGRLSAPRKSNLRTFVKQPAHQRIACLVLCPLSADSLGACHLGANFLGVHFWPFAASEPFHAPCFSTLQISFLAPQYATPYLLVFIPQAPSLAAQSVLSPHLSKAQCAKAPSNNSNPVDYK